MLSVADAATTRSRDLTSEQAIAEIRAITVDPDVLAEAAAILVAPWVPGAEPDLAAAELLVEAGADRHVVQRHADRRRGSDR